MSFSEPLASILRPKNLDEFIGQDHLVGEGKPLSAMIALGAPFSLIFWVEAFNPNPNK